LEDDEVAWATSAIYTTTTSKTTTPTADITTTSTDALIQGLASVSAAAAASASSHYPNHVIAEAQPGYDPDMTQLNSQFDAEASIQQSAGVRVSQEKLSLRIPHEEHVHLCDRLSVTQQPPKQQQ
jgi:hypothetical protein